MKFTSGFIWLTAVLFISCSKEGSGPKPPQANNYINTSSGSSWDYHLVDKSGTSADIDYTITSTSRDSSINGKNYHVYTSTVGSNEYRALSGHDYYQFDSLPAGLGVDAIERLYLKDDAGVGTTWNKNLDITVPGSPFPIPFTISNTIAGTGISKTVNGKSYTDVVHVSTNISSPVIPSTALVTDINSYYAPEYGLIENTSVVHLNYAGTVEDVDTENKLVSATLK